MRAWLVLPLLMAGTHASAATDELLFNGKDLKGWTGLVGVVGASGDSSVEKTWSVRDGAIQCAGGRGQGGHLYTDKSWTNFVLSFEFRWGQIDPEILKAGGNIYNAGVFFRASHRPDGARNIVFNYQSQIIHTPARAAGEAGGGTGDMWITGYDHPDFKGAVTPPPRAPDGRGGSGARGGRGGGGFGPLPPGVAPSRNFPRLKFTEKPIGQWNLYEITANGDKLTYRLNGEVVNTGTGAAVVAGKIGLECENTPIAFRNIRIRPL